MEKSFTCPKCKTRMPISFTLSWAISLHQAFKCKHCGGLLKQQKVVMPKGYSGALGMLVAVLTVFVGWQLDLGVFHFTILALLIFLVSMAAAVLYTYCKTKFIEAQ